MDLLTMDLLTKSQLSALDLLGATDTAPGRVRKYLSGAPSDIASGRLPHSCTLRVLNSATCEDIADALCFSVRSLKTGSGVKTVFDKNFALPVIAEPGMLVLTLSREHKDYGDCVAGEFASSEAPPAHARVTRIVVQDSMETESPLTHAGSIGIIDSWRETMAQLAQGNLVMVDLSNLRRKDSPKSDGTKASGPSSFARVYLAIAEFVQDVSMLTLLKLFGQMNETVLRGGFKRGIVTSMMHCDCAEFANYLAVPTTELGGSHKKGAIVNKRFATTRDAVLRDAVVRAVQSESIFLQKDTAELGPRYEGTYSNVCVGIMLRNACTCLIWRVNCGLIRTRQELIDAYCAATLNAVSLHVEWHATASARHRSLWQPIEQDRQIAIDLVGLANMLALFGYKYADFANDLEQLLKTGGLAQTPAAIARSEESANLPEWFAAAYVSSTKLAQQLAAASGLPEFDRLHTVEPAQAHAFELKDRVGATLARGIWPPFARVVNRMSDNQESVTVNHGAVQTVAEVGAQAIFRFNCLWQQLMDTYGLPHSISADIYHEFDAAAFDQWWASPLLTVYYNFSKAVDQRYARKQVEELDLGLDEDQDDPSQDTNGCSVCAQ